MKVESRDAVETAVKKRKVVTHRAQAHRDEFLSCCLLIAGGITDQIERRDCTEADLMDPDIVVVDQGMQHDSVLSNYDHHQFDRDAAPCCSITLILPLLDIDVLQAREIWNWLEFSERMDSKGPFQTGDYYGIPGERFFEWSSPVEAAVLRTFQAKDKINVISDIYALMEHIGKGLLEYLHGIQTRLHLLTSKVNFVKFQEFSVVDVLAIAKTDQPTLALEVWVKQQCELQPDLDCPVTLTCDDRGEGLCMYRRNDDPRIDFSRVAGQPGVVFTHANGFIVKIDKHTSWASILEASVVPFDLKAEVDLTIHITRLETIGIQAGSDEKST